jgi:hypothetical protein
MFEKLFKRKPKAQAQAPEAPASEESLASDDTSDAAEEAEAEAPPPPPKKAARVPSPDDDDYDPMSELPDFGTDDSDDEHDDELGLLPGFPTQSASSPSAPAAAAASDGEIDIDDQIAQLMAADSNAGQGFQARNMGDLVQDKAIYDGELTNEDGDTIITWATYAGKAAAAKNRRRFATNLYKGLSAMPGYQMGIVAALVVVIVLSLGYTVIASANTIMDKRIDLVRVEHYSVITQPVNVPNHTNFIFVNEYTELSGQPLTLTKISAGSTGTFFYFNETFDPLQYAIILFDQAHQLFYRSHFDLSGEMTSGTVLKFDGLNETTIFLNLFIKDIHTMESVMFCYRFNQFPAFATPVYYNDPIEILEESGMELRINHAVFDNASSQIHYSFNSTGGTGELRFGDYTNSSFMQASEGVHPLVGMTVNPAEARFDRQNTVLGVLNLAPVRRLTSNIEITLNGLYYRFNMHQYEIDMPALFARRPEEQVFRVKDHQLVLEGIAMQGNNIVLVLYGKDDSDKRVETRIDATLTIQTSDGVIVLEGVNYAGSEGCDVLFDITPYRRRLSGIPLSQYRLNIQAVEFKIPPFTVNLDLNQCYESPTRSMELAERHVWESFYTRLQYKSYEITRAEVTGFSNEIMNDRSLMRFYTPVGAETVPMYATHIITGMITPDGNNYIAIVEDEWVSGEGGDMIYMRHTHQVIMARTTGGGWVIVSDIIL